MKKFYTLLFIATVLLSSCTKDDDAFKLELIDTSPVEPETPTDETLPDEEQPTLFAKWKPEYIITEGVTLSLGRDCPMDYVMLFNPDTTAIEYRQFTSGCEMREDHYACTINENEIIFNAVDRDAEIRTRILELTTTSLKLEYIYHREADGDYQIGYTFIYEKMRN